MVAVRDVWSLDQVGIHVPLFRDPHHLDVGLEGLVDDLVVFAIEAQVLAPDVPQKLAPIRTQPLPQVTLDLLIVEIYCAGTQDLGAMIVIDHLRIRLQ